MPQYKIIRGLYRLQKYNYYFDNQIKKLKASIKKDYAKSFDLNLMKTSGFIPVDKRQGDFFIIIDKTKLNEKEKIENAVKEKFSDLSPIHKIYFANSFAKSNFPTPSFPKNK